MNILVCTPGRLLQHLDETVGFDAAALQVFDVVVVVVVAVSTIKLTDQFTHYTPLAPRS
jgi:hypothetical protein